MTVNDFTDKDFAKIVRASNGQQMLVFMEPSDDDDKEDCDCIVHVMTDIPVGRVDSKIYVTNENAARRFIAGFGQDNADAFLSSTIMRTFKGVSSEVEKPETP